jgi:hypothetical protein
MTSAMTQLPARDTGTERDHLAGDLEAGNIRRARRRRIEALALHDVGPVDAGGRDLDQDFALGRCRHRALLRRQNLRPTRAFDADDGHVRGEQGHEVPRILRGSILFRRATAK